MNILLQKIFINFLRFPLFMDTIFTAAITFAFGLIPGLIVAVFSWLVPSIYHGTFSFFVLCSITEVLIICALKPRTPDIPAFTPKEKIIASYTVVAAKLMILYIICAIAISVLGGLINLLPQIAYGTHTDYFGVDDLFKLGLITNNLPTLAVNILSRIPINIVDRFIVIFGGYLISRALVKITPTTHSAA
ncbi:MAG: hypothetical protein FWD47_11295 [Treponema sp.]|nr:hypothetical protein [Treponema sp.]